MYVCCTNCKLYYLYMLYVYLHRNKKRNAYVTTAKRQQLKNTSQLIHQPKVNMSDRILLDYTFIRFCQAKYRHVCR